MDSHAITAKTESDGSGNHGSCMEYGRALCAVTETDSFSFHNRKENIIRCAAKSLADLSSHDLSLYFQLFSQFSKSFIKFLILDIAVKKSLENIPC